MDILLRYSKNFKTLSVVYNVIIKKLIHILALFMLNNFITKRKK